MQDAAPGRFWRRLGEITVEDELGEPGQQGHVVSQAELMADDRERRWPITWPLRSGSGCCMRRGWQTPRPAPPRLSRQPGHLTCGHTGVDDGI